MGRSVNTVSDAVCVVFIEHHCLDCDDWSDFIIDIRCLLRVKYPSFCICDKWDDSEERRILENDFARVVVCEYGRIATINLAPIDESVLGENWCRQISQGFTDLLRHSFTTLRQCGHLSNGEAVYELSD